MSVFILFAVFSTLSVSSSQILGLSADHDEEALRNCTASLKKDVPIIEIIARCLQIILPKGVHDCLLDNPPSDRDTLFTAGLKCVPGIPEGMRDLLLKRQNEVAEFREIRWDYIRKYEGLSLDEKNTMDFTLEGKVLREEMRERDGNPNLEKFARDHNVPVDFLETMYQYYQAELNDYESFNRLQKYERTLCHGPELDAIHSCYALASLPYPGGHRTNLSSSIRKNPIKSGLYISCVLLLFMRYLK